MPLKTDDSLALFQRTIKSMIQVGSQNIQANDQKLIIKIKILEFATSTSSKKWSNY